MQTKHWFIKVSFLSKTFSLLLITKLIRENIKYYNHQHPRENKFYCL